MRKFLVALAAVLLVVGVQAQTDTSIVKSSSSKKKDWSKVNLTGRSNDHFMIEMGYDGWGGAPDSIRTKGFGRHLNIYLMLDKPFKSDPRLSVGLGIGVGSSNIYFDKQEPKIAGTTSTLQFKDVSDTNHFKKFKMTEAWVEVPLELRYASNPENTNKSFKAALGFKIGFMINAHTKGKTLQNSTGSTLNSYTAKEADKDYFNTTRLAGTARVGYGPFTLYGAYQFNSLIKENRGPQVHPFSIGLCISGL
ncbi:outer membrane beta-barrel protein [Flavihumibacter fluvii]|uniref:outer membrane beta-barrel protein n=1 Tax=Flavihumibacter fluvii TaxID=2838157 RepID=UPI001BDDFF02|nr:outer membrane beta-barrel protein [Flavihumibacter fluvii]ULQ52185.1 PorT family protein [Flavihumibacter fluvii]